MNEKNSSALRNGFCIYINTFCQGPVPVVSDGEDNYIVFETELEAQREIVDNLQIHLQQFLDGERDFEDAITVEEYVVPVTVHPDGTITDEDGRCFGPRVECRRSDAGGRRAEGALRAQGASVNPAE
jgi:hypothetical protein